MPAAHVKICIIAAISNKPVGIAKAVSDMLITASPKCCHYVYWCVQSAASHKSVMQTYGNYLQGDGLKVIILMYVAMGID